MEDKRKRRDFDLELKRQKRQMEHATQLAEVQQKIEEHKQMMKDIADERERQNAMAQKMHDLEKMIETTERARQAPHHLHTSPRKASDPSANGPLSGEAASSNHLQSPPEASNPSANGPLSGESASSNHLKSPPEASTARVEWDRQKQMEGQSNDALDSLMGLIGLEEVKDKFLSIKAKVDTVVRQNISLKDERFSAALLGNPGTGTYGGSFGVENGTSLSERELTSFRQDHRRSPVWPIPQFGGSDPRRSFCRDVWLSIGQRWDTGMQKAPRRDLQPWRWRAFHR